MKQFILSGLAGAALLVSCKTANTAGTAERTGSKAAQAQADRAEFLKMKGTWQITSVDYDQSFKVRPFDQGTDAQCFVGSQWMLIPNNYSGTYTLNGGGDCPTVTQPIRFEVANGTEFKFKKIAADTKAKVNTAGYSLNLVNRTADTFTLEQAVPSNGEVVRIQYNFQKIK